MAAKTQPSVNELAMPMVKRLMDDSDQLQVEVHEYKGKATIIDCGIDVSVMSPYDLDYFPKLERKVTD